MPGNTCHKDGKRHVHTIPVKLCCPQNNQRKLHIDAYFAMASVKYTRDLVELFSDEHVFVLSQGDKARVLIGLPVSKKQDVMLMHLEYKVSFPDHDFPPLENSTNQFHLYTHHASIKRMILPSVTMDPLALRYRVANMIKAVLYFNMKIFKNF